MGGRAVVSNCKKHLLVKLASSHAGWLLVLLVMRLVTVADAGGKMEVLHVTSNHLFLSQSPYLWQKCYRNSDTSTQWRDNVHSSRQTMLTNCVTKLHPAKMWPLLMHPPGKNALHSLQFCHLAIWCSMAACNRSAEARKRLQLVLSHFWRYFTEILFSM